MFLFYGPDYKFLSSDFMYLKKYLVFADVISLWTKLEILILCNNCFHPFYSFQVYIIFINLIILRNAVCQPAISLFRHYYANRNASNKESLRKVSEGFAAAIGSSVGVTLLLHRVFEAAKFQQTHNLLIKFIPFFAVSAGSIIPLPS